MKTLIAAALAICVPTFAMADGDPVEGEKLFKRCSACHVIADGDNVIDGKGKTGPNLYGVVGRVAGTQEDFGKKYGKSVVEAGAAGLVWTEEEFTEYVQDPTKFLRATLDDGKARSKMTFKLKKGGEDVWAYLVSVNPPAE